MSTLKLLLQQIDLTNRRRHLICPHDSIVLAVSGGPDSMALLELFAKLRQKFFLNMAVAHLDHGLTHQSAAFRDTAEKAARSHGFPFFLKHVSLRLLAKKNKRSVEEMGRIERYRFLESVARKILANKIATAHTLDDQAETMLMRIFRGSGLRGLAGISYRRPLGKATVIRPLLDCSKKDILAFLKENHVRFCVDKTNRDPAFTRNRIRTRILPQIERLFNPQIKQSLASLQAVCFEAQEYLGSASEKALKNCIKKHSSRNVSMDEAHLKRLPRAVLSDVWLRAIEIAKGDANRLTYEHLMALSQLLWSHRPEAEIHLPGLRAKKTRHHLILTCRG